MFTAWSYLAIVRFKLKIKKRPESGKSLGPFELHLCWKWSVNNSFCSLLGAKREGVSGEISRFFSGFQYALLVTDRTRGKRKAISAGWTIGVEIITPAWTPKLIKKPSKRITKEALSLRCKD